MTDEVGRIVPIRINDEMRTAYLDYAMSVIVVARCPTCATASSRFIAGSCTACRIWACLSATYRKCAGIVGDVLGKMHPHGDAAVYDALVRLAQTLEYALPADRRPGQLRLASTATRQPPCDTPRRASRRSPKSCCSISIRTPSISR